MSNGDQDKKAADRVVEACAIILPPMGFFSFAAYGPADASGFDMT